MVPDNCSAEQEEPPTTTNDTEENTTNTNTQPIENAQTEGPDMVERNELGRAGPTTQAEGANMSTPMGTERVQDTQQLEEVPMNINDMGPPTMNEHEEDVPIN